MQIAVLVAFVVNVIYEPDAQMLFIKVLPGRTAVDEATTNVPVEVAIVRVELPTLFVAVGSVAGAAVEVVATVSVSATSPVPVYAVWEVPTPLQAARIAVT